METKLIKAYDIPDMLLHPDEDMVRAHLFTAKRDGVEIPFRIETGLQTFTGADDLPPSTFQILYLGHEHGRLDGDWPKGAVKVILNFRLANGQTKSITRNLQEAEKSFGLGEGLPDLSHNTGWTLELEIE